MAHHIYTYINLRYVTRRHIEDEDPWLLRRVRVDVGVHLCKRDIMLGVVAQ